mmetsp:Transcript_69426/g.190576  ORF Transcript_69426/g.190576 Transcript_69426/m.190576 type:complete len:269 (-) Transcript_69426:261-1067(-)
MLPMRFTALALACNAALAQQQQGFNANGMPEPPSLTKTAMNLFDKDHNGAVTLKETQETLSGLAAFGAMGSEPGKQSDIEKMITQAKAWMPQFFKLLDSDSSGTLSEGEVEWVEKGLEAAKTNVFKNLTRDIFETLDVNSDATLAPDELEAAVEPEMYAKLVALIVEAFPLPGLTSDTSQALVKANLQGIVAALDGDGNGSIERKEAGVAHGNFKRAFIKAAESLKTMGPMLAMFGGGDMGGMGGGMPMGGMPGGRGRGGGGRGARRN